MFHNRIRRLMVLTAMLGCFSILAINTGCDERSPLEQLTPTEQKVQKRAAWPLFWKRIAAAPALEY